MCSGICWLDFPSGYDIVSLPLQLSPVMGIPHWGRGFAPNVLQDLV